MNLTKSKLTEAKIPRQRFFLISYDFVAKQYLEAISKIV